MARPCKFKSMEREPWRDGIFHRWGEGWVYGNGDERLPHTTAIVEDWETGEVYTVEPDQLRFTPTPDLLDVSDEAVSIRTRLAQVEK